MTDLGYWVGIGSADFEIFIMIKLEIEDFLKLFVIMEVLKLPNIFLVRVIPKSLVILLLSHGSFTVFLFISILLCDSNL